LMEVFRLPGVAVATGVGVGVAWLMELPIPWHPERKRAAAKARVTARPLFISLA